MLANRDMATKIPAEGQETLERNTGHCLFARERTMHSFSWLGWEEELSSNVHDFERRQKK